MARLAVVAVGGNALIVDPRRSTLDEQYKAVQATCRSIADLIAQDWTVVITHGNGPQVGFALRRSEMARESVHPVTLDVAVADTQGTIGYYFQQVLSNELRQRGLDRTCATVITQVEVAADDPAFRHPTKPIGGFMDEATARSRSDVDGWSVIEDAGRGWRRVVPSPRPQAILELGVVRSLVEAGICVIGAGGGGVPVVLQDGHYRGVAAVIDKDLSSGLLAQQLQADLFLILTAVESVSLHFGTPEQAPLKRVSLEDIRLHLSEGHFKAGSMKPKVEAALTFVEKTGKRAVITDAAHLSQALSGQAGTEIVAG